MKLSRQIVAMTVCVLLTAVIAVTAVAGFGVYEILHRQARSDLQTIAEARKSAFVDFHDQLLRSIETQAGSILLAEAMLEFDVAWSSLNNEEQIALQSRYSDDGFFLAGDEGFDDTADTRSGFDRVHSRYHPTFLDMQQANDFSDLLLVNEAGLLVYSAAKHRDFGRDMTALEWRGSALAKALRQFSQSDTAPASLFFDYHRYQGNEQAIVGFAAAPVYIDDRFRGLLAYQIRLDVVDRLMTPPAGFAETGEVLLVGDDFTVRNDTAFTRDAPLNRRLDNEAAQLAFAGQSGFVMVESSAGHHLAYATPVDIGGEVFALVVSQPVTAFLMPFEKLGLSAATIIAAVICLLTAISVIGARRLARPVEQIAALQTRLASGETNIGSPELSSPREAADLSEATFVFRKQARNVERYRAEAEENVPTKSPGIDSASLARQEEALAAAMKALSQAMPQVSGKAEDVSMNASQLSERSDSISGDASQFVGEVEALAATAEKVNAAFDDVAERLGDTAGLSNSAARQASDVAARFDDLSGISARLDTLSDRISDVANRTNIVSLNASLEAARAGGDGAGFDVIAREIKSLSGQIQQVAEETRQRNAELQAEMDATATAVRMVSDTAQNATDTVSTVEGAIALQAMATGNVALAAQGAVGKVETIAGALKSVVEGATTTEATSDELRATAEELVQTGTSLVNEVTELLARIKGDA